MGETTAISWCHVPGYIGGTWNCWQGCTKVSEGCANCYMFREKERFGQNPNIVVRSKPRTFNLPLRVKEPHAWFTCSWSDFLHEDADVWRDEAWDIIRQTPQHLYLILTKRIERWNECAPKDWCDGYPNVWLGVTAENQKRYDERVPLLLRIPVKVHWISFEPLLERIIPVPFDMVTSRFPLKDFAFNCKWAGFYVIGGESGPNCRSMDHDWALKLIQDAHMAGVAAYVKQLGGYPDKRTEPSKWPEDLRCREFPQTGKDGEDGK